jgi:polynucleotide 5'-hydroxyl-kinase GRC3/NOL9
MDVLPEWIDVRDEIINSPIKVIVVLGDVDTGKTTFVTWLCNELHTKEGRVSIVDADVGQSDVGPPTTIGMAIIDRNISNLSSLDPQALYFVGSISPEGHMLEMIVGTRQMIKKGIQAGAKRVVVDTTGLIHGSIGAALKIAKIRNIGEQAYIIGIQRNREIEHILKPFNMIKDRYRIVRLPVPNSVKITSKEMRSNIRAQRFAKYFKDAVELNISFTQIATTKTPFLSGQKLKPNELRYYERMLDEIVIYGEQISTGKYLVLGDKVDNIKDTTIIQATPEDFHQLIVGLIDAHDNLLGLGIIQDISFNKEKIRIKTPVRSEKDIVVLEFGQYRYYI